MSTLRTNERQWLIDTEDPVVAAMEAMEVMALTITGKLLAENGHVEIRAIGNVMMRWADARQRVLDGEDATDAEQAAIESATEILDWMGGQGECPEGALDQFHAVAFTFDSKLQAAGISGPGWYRELARGEHGR